MRRSQPPPRLRRTAASAAVSGSPARTPSHRWCATAPERGVPRGRERVADPPMQMGSAGAADLLEKGLAYQGVGEREHAGSVGHFPEQPGSRGLVERDGRDGRGHAGGCGDGGQVELAADNCRDREEVVRFARSTATGVARRHRARSQEDRARSAFGWWSISRRAGRSRRSRRGGSRPPQRRTGSRRSRRAKR